MPNPIAIPVGEKPYRLMHRFNPKFLVALTLAIFLAITYSLWRGARQDAIRSLQTSFDIRAHDTVDHLAQRMQTYEQVLRGARGFLSASGNTTREGFRTYVNTLRLEEHYPGIQGLAISLVVPPAMINQHTSGVRKQGYTDYAIHPPGDRDIYTSIIQIEPYSGLNPMAMGFDMFTEPVRRNAMERARDSGKAALSGKVKLAQDDLEHPQAGFVMYMPVYKHGMPADTVEERRANITGWVGAPFRMNDLMSGLEGKGSSDLHVRIYDGVSKTDAAMLYDSGDHSGDSTIFSTTTRIDIAGEPWQVSINALRSYEAAIDNGKAYYIATAGIGASAMLALLIWLLATGRVRALALATEMSEELRASEFRWKFALEGAGDGVWDWSCQTDDVKYSSRWKEMLGYTDDEIENRVSEWKMLVHPDDRLPTMTALQDYLAGRTPAYIHEHRMLTKDGRWKWILSRGSIVSRDEQGRPVRMIGTHKDITERKLAENALREARDELEVRVWQRTADLVQANELLTSEIEEREKVEAELFASRTRLATIFDAVAEGLVVYDKDGRMMELNFAARQILGLTRGQLSSSVYTQSLKAVNEDNTPFPVANHPAIVSLRSGQPTRNVVMGIYKARDTLTWISVNTQPLFDESGNVSMVVVNFSDITEKKQSEELIWKQANFDALTGLPNRRMFQDHLEQEVRKARRTGLPIALMFLDLDHFKDINDTLGHGIGDLLLKEAAKRLKSCVRDSDTVARLGGDEFTVVLCELHDVADVARIAHGIQQKMALPFSLGIETAYISASIGITIYPDDATDIETLLRNADQAMYAAKNQGRNRYRYFTESMQEATQARMWLANELRSALNEKQFSMVYQPIVDLATGGIGKAEALIRWNHPTRGLIEPAMFIPIAEETGLIIDIGNWVFREVANQVKQWRKTHHPKFQISINKSPVEFHNKDTTQETWFTYLESLGLPGQCIAVEITEGLLLDASTTVTDLLLEFRDAGIQVSLDDFGTGYSSLSYLKKFDIDNLKIDQSFVRNLSQGSDDLALCEAIVVMAHKLNIAVIAEGVETEQQRDLLAAVGCDYGQGYLFSRPVPAEEFV